MLPTDDPAAQAAKPALVIMHMQRLIRAVAPPPDWLEKARTGAKQRRFDQLTPITPGSVPAGRNNDLAPAEAS